MALMTPITLWFSFPVQGVNSVNNLFLYSKNKNKKGTASMVNIQ